jgi:hypothetical protein
MKQPDQQFFDKCYMLATKHVSESSVYIQKPLQDVPYPFIEMGAAILIPRATKTAILGSVSLTMHVWGNGDDRIEISDIINNLLMDIKGIRSTESLRWLVPLNQCNIQLLQDTSTGTNLWHGVLDVTAQFY